MLVVIALILTTIFLFWWGRAMLRYDRWISQPYRIFAEGGVWSSPGGIDTIKVARQIDPVHGLYATYVTYPDGRQRQLCDYEWWALVNERYLTRISALPERVSVVHGES